MAIITFKSKACGELYMFRQTAEKIFDVIGRKLTEQGAIPPEAIPAAITAIKKEIEKEKALIQEYKAREEDRFRKGVYEEEKKEPPVFFTQRAFPFLEMLEFSLKEETPVFWGVP